MSSSLAWFRLMTTREENRVSMTDSLPSVEPHIEILQERIIQCEGSWTIPHLMRLDRELNTIQWPVGERAGVGSGEYSSHGHRWRNGVVPDALPSSRQWEADGLEGVTSGV